jgi:hypothetical protein
MADVKGIMMGGAGHDAATIVAAILSQRTVSEMSLDDVVHLYEHYRDAILESNEKAQAAQRDASLPSDPGSVVVALKAAQGKTIREVYEATDNVGASSGPEYLTWIVANLGESKPALVAAVRKFLSDEAKTK